jgi:hypothetical protein
MVVVVMAEAQAVAVTAAVATAVVTTVSAAEHLRGEAEEIKAIEIEML